MLRWPFKVRGGQNRLKLNIFGCENSALDETFIPSIRQSIGQSTGPLVRTFMSIISGCVEEGGVFRGGGVVDGS